MLSQARIAGSVRESVAASFTAMTTILPSGRELTRLAKAAESAEEACVSNVSQ